MDRYGHAWFAKEIDDESSECGLRTAITARRCLTRSRDKFRSDIPGRVTDMENAMRTKARQVILGGVWKSEATGEIYIVTSFCRDSSHAYLRRVEPSSIGFRKAKLLETGSGETLIGFSLAEDDRRQ